ncbi:hypothetical protein CAEBREN_05273 [Caenorhabditis brenneri]|uniref:Ribonuclease P protein subunit p29 n=1 Tax=Caenorhabditis brenneri TaxID=135651 RepID=G0NTR6_CAEBE|nr:hypothetical protein CAEBREN_05273 [Caenorhabditis brenneri]
MGKRKEPEILIGEPSSSDDPSSSLDRLGILHLDKNETSYFKRKPAKTEKTNLTRGRLTKEDKKAFKFADIVPMNTDWQKYFRERLHAHFATKKIDKQILKADYHGALLTVWSAENSTQIGISGIVVLETRHTFQMVTQDDRFVVIPKKGSVFRFIIGDRLFSLFGDGMRTRPAWRGKKPRVKRVIPTFIRGTLQPVPTGEKEQ